MKMPLVTSYKLFALPLLGIFSTLFFFIFSFIFLVFSMRMCLTSFDVKNEKTCACVSYLSFTPGTKKKKKKKGKENSSHINSAMSNVINSLKKILAE